MIFFGNGSAIHPYLFRIGQIESRWRWREGSIHEKPERVDRQEKEKEKEEEKEKAWRTKMVAWESPFANERLQLDLVKRDGMACIRPDFG